MKSIQSTQTRLITEMEAGMKVFLVISVTTLARAVKVISTERADLGGQGEMLDTSLKEYEEFSLCARFETVPAST